MGKNTAIARENAISSLQVFHLAMEIFKGRIVVSPFKKWLSTSFACAGQVIGYRVRKFLKLRIFKFARYRKGYFCYLLLFFSLFFSAICIAGSKEIYPFNSTIKKIQFEQLIQEFRCLVCQNQNLADSNAPLAKDLRQIIYQRLKKGETEQQIKQYLVSRYGVYILFKPPFSPLTYLLWLGPFILLLIIFLKVVISRPEKEIKH